MGIVSILSGDSPVRTSLKNTLSGDDLLIVDATISEETSLSSDITEYPVEDGSDVSDNARRKPIVINIEGECSESPIDLRGAVAGLLTGAAVQAGLQAGFNPLLGTAVGAGLGGAIQKYTVQTDDSGTGIQRITNPAEDAREILSNAWEFKKLLTVSHRSKQYPNMLIQSLSFPRRQGDGKKLVFRMSLKQVRIVRPLTLVVNNTASEQAHGVAPIEEGKKGTKAASTQARQKGSILFNAFKSFGIVGGG